MNKKVIFVVMLILIFTISGLVYFMGISPKQKKEQAKEDPFSKPRIEGVEENINGFNIEDDFRMTQKLQVDREKLLALNPQERKQVLENIGPKRKNTVLHQYNTTLPENINKTLKYFKYNISYDYLLVTAEDGAQIRENPDPATTAKAKLTYLDKVSLLQRVDGEKMAGSNIWYRVALETNGQIIEGYLHSTKGDPRRFRFEVMQNAVNKLKQEVAEGALHFISNYRNQNGTPPRMGEIKVGKFGYRVYHSVPAYVEASTDSNYRYAPDGMLVRILNEVDNFYYVNILSFGGNYYIPKQYIDPDVKLSQLDHVVVVDNSQQNQAAFELVQGGLNLVSYTLATTGIQGEHSFKTSPGIYKAQEKRERFEYLKKGSEQIAGYAPYATRFSGGAYIHGIPVAYEEQNGQKVDPGHKEYIHTIGTFPRSSMCVRNFTSHAKFIYDWMNSKNGAVIVIE